MHISILLMEQIVELFIEISLDGIENEELRDPKKCYQYIKDDQKYYLLLDEVQFMPRFEEVLNSLLRISNIWYPDRQNT